MNIIANENVFDPMVQALRELGHDVLDTKHTVFAGSADDLVYGKAVADKLVVVTMDKDFTRMLRFPPDKCGGIVVVELYRMTVAEATERLRRAFAGLSPDKVAGRLTIIDRRGVRHRSPS